MDDSKTGITRRARDVGSEWLPHTDLLSLASLALSVPRWAEVALFFWVLDISYSISSIFLRMSPMVRLC